MVYAIVSMAVAIPTAVTVAPHMAAAQAPAPATSPSAEARKEEAKATMEEVRRVAQKGPVSITLLDQGVLNLPAGQVFIPAATANRFMAALGNRKSDSRFGVILPTDGKQPWLIDIKWIKEGYVKDGDAKEWQADAMLDSLKESTNEDNKRREAEGIPALEITDWVEKPTYNDNSHQLIWSLAAKEKGAAADQPQTVNYNTYALGRDGFFSLDLITGADTIAADKGAVKAVLDGLAYNQGKRYEDFNASTDKILAPICSGSRSGMDWMAWKRGGLSIRAGWHSWPNTRRQLSSCCFRNWRPSANPM